jgi:hypothetical protein
MSYIIKKFIYQVFALLLKINISLFKKKLGSDLICNFQNSFGDSCAFYIQNHGQIIKKNNKILVYSEFEKKIASFFFINKKILNTFFFIPKFIPIYSISLILDKFFYKYSKKNRVDYKKKVDNKIIIFLENLLQSRLDTVSKKIKKLKKLKYIVFYVKHINENINDLNIESGAFRQTANKKKIFEILNFITKKKYKVVILGDIKEKINNEIKNKIKNKNILFLSELSGNQNMIDQLYLHYHCNFAVGSDCGAFIFSHFLKKKILFFDSIKNNYGLQKKENIIFLFKKIFFNNEKSILLNITMLKSDFMKNKIFNVSENSVIEIKDKILKLI